MLSDAQIVRRCEPQVFARSGDPGYRGIRRAVLGLAYSRSYQAGDLVRLVDTRRLPNDMLGSSHFDLILCRIPKAGSQDTTGPHYSAAMTGYRLKELCAETYAIPPRSHPDGWSRPDLREARVVARDSARGVTAVFFTLKGKNHGCLIAPSSVEPPYSVSDQATRGYRTWFVPIAVPRDGSPDSFRWVYATWGRVPPGADTLTFIRSDGTTASVAVAEDGSYAMAVQDSSRKMTFKAQYRFSADSSILGSGPALRR